MPRTELHFPGSWLTEMAFSSRATPNHFRLKHSGRSFAQRKRFRMTVIESNP